MEGVDFRLLYVPVGTLAEARMIAATLVDERLVACANIIPAIESVYRWQGKVRREGEVLMLAKTRAELVDRARTRITALHSYAVPCVAALDISSANAPYLAWLAAETEQN
jgi:periplasmic divalent cation tolerance protein